MGDQEFKRQILGEFVGHTMEMQSLDKNEITEILNMMFRFHLRTGSYFKVEEYAETVFILTDVKKLLGKDLASFHRKLPRISDQIWFTQLPDHKTLVNFYEDCPKKRQIYYAPYEKGTHFLNILNRTQSMSFILES